MSFLGFGKRKGGPTSGSREIHTVPANANLPAALVNGVQPKDKLPSPGLQITTPTSSVNNSLNSLGGGSIQSPEPTTVPRTRSEDGQYGSRPVLTSAPNAIPNTIPSAISNANLYPWSRQELVFSSSQQNPFPRYGAAVNATSSKEGNIYVMGGLVNGQTVKGDLWMIEAAAADQLSCYPVRTEQEGPGPRVGHASLLVGNAFIVFGGDTKQDESDPLDDTLYLLNTATKQWSRALPPGPRPPGRYGHTLNILGSRLYVFGGQNDGNFFNDLVAFDLNQLQSPSNTWDILVPDNLDVDSHRMHVPPARTNHTVITWNEKLFLFGGTDGIQWFNDVWTYDPRTNSWTQLDCIGYIPQPREGHSAALVNEVMYIFGGRTQEGTDLGDLAAFRITSRRWYTFQNMGPSPSPRSGHSMTAYDKQIVVLAGEPSSNLRDPNELSLVYILDTTKIRYPTDQQTTGGERATGGSRRPSISQNLTLQNKAPVVRETGQTSPMSNASPSGPQGSRLPRAAGPSPQGAPPVSPGPPPQQRVPSPRNNGVISPTGMNARSRTPTKGYGVAAEMPRAVAFERQDASTAGMEPPRGPVIRSMSPALVARPTPVQQQPSKLANNISEVPESSTTNGRARSQSRSTRPQPALEIGDATQHHDDHLQRTQRLYPDELEDAPAADKADESSSRDNSPMKRMQPDALMKDLETERTRNAWYASELALARKAGYIQSTPNGPVLDEGSFGSVNDDDRQLVEALVSMKAELAEVQSSMSSRAQEAATKVAEAEQQRDAAIKEAVYARAKLAAHGGSQAGTPQLDDSARDLDPERSADMSRKLGAALAAQSELRSRYELLTEQHETERQAREVAEENAEAAQKRAEELQQAQNPGEIEELRADLHDAQKAARDEAAQRVDAHAKAQLLEIDNEDLQRRLDEVSALSETHAVTLMSLREAVTASQDKMTVLENQLQAERERSETTQRKLSQLKVEHEECAAELETTVCKLRDAEELAETNAREAQTHRNAVIMGFEKLGATRDGDVQSPASDKRALALQEQVQEANALAQESQAEADLASEKLRRAEERIAGLETYQQQSSREGLRVRKQLQESMRTAQTLQLQYNEARQQVESHQRSTGALLVQHGALRDLLDERAVSASPGRTRRDSVDETRIQDLEQQLQESHRAHDETKLSLQASQKESEKDYREKLEQLEQDYQSAVSYVKGTEKMLKRMKDELTKSKTMNSRLQAEVEQNQRSAAERETSAGWESERQALRREIEEMQESVQVSIVDLEGQVAEVRRELKSTQEERERYRSESSQLSRLVQQAQNDTDKLRHDNSALEARATDAENKVSMLLDQVESSVDHYRRQSRQSAHPAHPNGTTRHRRNTSSSSTYDNNNNNNNNSGSGSGSGNGNSNGNGNGNGNQGHGYSDSMGGESVLSGGGADRSSMALDNLASELETLRTQWEGSHRSYRLSHELDFERSEGNGGGGGGGELSSSLASWRKRLEAEERVKASSRGPAEEEAGGVRRGGGDRAIG